MPIIVAFFTAETLYEAEASRLIHSLDRLGLQHDVVAVADRGSWAANASMTAAFLSDSLAKHKGPIVYVNADAIFWTRPALFEQIDPTTCDIAFHRCNWGQLANGTLWLSNSDACRSVIQEYAQRVEACAQPTKDEQRYLDHAIKAAAGIRIQQLPASYCYIHDIMPPINAGDIVIEHLQASREAKQSKWLPSRRKRLIDIEHALV